jgi:hypothetical protein
MNFAAGQKRERRLYENTAMVAVRQERVIGLLWTRRGRKSTTLGNMAFDELSVGAGRTVIGASASLLLGTELVSMTVTAAEQAMVVSREAAAVRDVFTSSATEKQLDFKCANSETGEVYENISAENYADLYQSKRLEMRLYFDRTNYSRELIIAPNPATARGWGGTVFRDEVGYTRPQVEVELQIAVDPIFRTDPTFKMIYASNLPRDDRHPWFEMTLPPPDMTFPANSAGHFYRGLHRMLIHRVSLSDAYAAGHVLYDNKGQPMTLEEFRGDPGNRMQLACSYDLIHESGGASVIDIVSMYTAQQRGSNNGCRFIYVDSDVVFQKAINHLAKAVKDGQIGIGFDVATTTGEISNPSSVTIREKIGNDRYDRLKLAWKEKKPQIARERLRRIVETIRLRANGGPARRLCIDASNERYFAEETADILAPLIPVQLVIAGNAVEPRPEGYSERDGNINYKTWLGDLEAANVNDGRLALPPGEYIKNDYRMVMKDAGKFVCIPDVQTGAHGDTFDSGKLAELALLGGTRGQMIPPSGIRARVVADRRNRSISC